jgi:hypothetical protein
MRYKYSSAFLIQRAGNLISSPQFLILFEAKMHSQAVIYLLFLAVFPCLVLSAQCFGSGADRTIAQVRDLL